MSARMLCFAALIGCAGDKNDEGDSGSAGTGDTPIVYPSADRILIYDGHGGLVEDGTGEAGFDDVDARWKAAFTWNTDVKSTWPDSLDSYRAIFLVAPGATGEVAFDADQVQALAQALEQGARVVIMGGIESCGSTSVSDLLGALGVSERFSGEGTDANRLIDGEQLSSSHQITADLTTIRFKEPCFLEPGSDGSTLMRTSDRDPILVAERPGHGGEVVLAGDFHFMDDGGLIEYGDNGLFADNLVVIEP